MKANGREPISYLAQLSFLSLAVFDMSEIAWHIQVCPCIKFKILAQYLSSGVQKLMEDNQKDFLAEFSALSLPVFDMCEIS
jgi:hypothetical protein